MMPHAQVIQLFFPSSERAAIVDLACRDPMSVGRPLTHWSQRSLAQTAMEQALVAHMSHVTVGEILHQADLQPHRFRWWKTTIWTEEAIARARKILWYYERVDSLWQRGEVVLAIDEKPNLQVLERAAPTQVMRPAYIERQEFDYLRHGTVHLLVGLTLHTGHMWAECLDKNDGEHFRPALRRWLHPYSWAKRLHVVIDNGASHISEATSEFFASLAPRVHMLWTPVNASWLNQAEALLEAFSERYLVCGSWNHADLMWQHIVNSTHDYNRHFARPFAWQWSCRDFRWWLNNTPDLIRCKT